MDFRMGRKGWMKVRKEAENNGKEPRTERLAEEKKERGTKGKSNSVENQAQ